MTQKRSNAGENLVSIIALVPWWAGCALALLLYLLLHAVVPAAQYALPALCLAAAAISAYLRHQRKKQPVYTGSSHKAADFLNGISWPAFELLISEAMRLQGFQVFDTSGAHADFDLVLRKGNAKYLVQCKLWKSLTVGVTVVREFDSAVVAQKAAGGYVLTAGRFTDAARAFAKGRNITLMEGPALQKLIEQAQAARQAGTGKAVP